MKIGVALLLAFLFPVNAWISYPSFSTQVVSSQLAMASGETEIIGGGRIGSFLASAENARLLGRGDSIDPDNAGQPIYICTRNDSLEDIIVNCPPQRRADLTFLQNGYLDDLLTKHNLLEDATQVLLYLSIPSMGATPVDGVTTYNPEGLTTAVGKHAAAFAERLESLNMKCNVVTSYDYRPAMFEKLIWICTYMLVGTANNCDSVGQAGTQHKELVEQVIAELMGAVQKAEGLEFQPGTLPRLAAYTEVVADFPCGVKEFEWRNQYFYKLDCPIHNGLLEECAKDGKLGFDLPPK